MAALYLMWPLHLICLMISSVSGLFVLFWTHVECASIEVHRRRNLIISWSSFRFGIASTAHAQLYLMSFQYYVHCKQPLPMDVDFMFSDSLEVSFRTRSLFMSWFWLILRNRLYDPKCRFRRILRRLPWPLMWCTTLPIRLLVGGVHLACRLRFVPIPFIGFTDESGEDSGDDDDDDKHSNADHDEDEGADEDEELQQSLVRTCTFHTYCWSNLRIR